MAPLFANRRVIVCAGTGGVGKTTISAAIAVAAAASGRRTLVMTIDPARRLANALGLTDFGSVVHEVPKEALAQYQVELKAPLFAMMPDVKRTFDDLISRLLPDVAERQKLFDNRIYRQFSTVIAGSLEYAAVEKLYEMVHSNEYDLIVLDTPPAYNAFAFLRAPGRIIDFLEQETVQWLLKPYAAAGKMSLKILDLGTAFIFKTLGRFAGGDTLRELANFVLGFQTMYEGFRERSQAVQKLLRSDELGFVLVATTAATQQAAMQRFRDQLKQEGLKTRAIVINRVRQPAYAPSDRQTLEHQVHELLPDAKASAQVLRAIHEEQTLALIDQSTLEELRARSSDTPILAIPELPLDAHDLESLAQLHRFFL